MIKSMTGFGRSELKTSQGLIRAEIKTINHKFFEISTRLPGHLSEFEDAIRKAISQEIRRGKASLYVSSPDPSVFSSRLILNEALAKEVFHKIQRLKNVLKLDPEKANKTGAQSMILREVLHFPEVLTKDTSSNQKSSFYRDLQKTISLALKNLKASRIQEGKALEKDILGRVAEVKKSLNVIEKRIPAIEKEYRKTFGNKMKEFLKEGQLDHERLTLEVAMYVKNSDISEEVTRMKSHMDGMKKALKENGEVGRKIDFIAQEMYRESNTMGAKSSDVATANQVIQIKSAVEKIREQAQNVE